MNTDYTPLTGHDSEDLWDELVSVGHVAAPSPTALASARNAASTARRRDLRIVRARQNRRRVRIGLVAAATATILAIGATTIDIGGHPVAPSAAAAATLTRAATATLAQHDPVVGPGQFLKITLVEQSWMLSTDEDGPLYGEDGQPAATQERRTRTIWIPHDVTERWIVRNSRTAMRSASSDPRYQGFAEPTTTRTMDSWAAADSPRHLQTYDPQWYASLPRNPQKLLAALDADFTGEGSGLAYRFSENYQEILGSGLAPADIRAALFTGLSTISGMQVNHDVQTLDGRSGTAIGAIGSTFSMIFDDATGLYIGTRATNPDFPEVEGLDQAKTTWLTSVTTTVVDHAPTDAPYVASQPG